MSTACLRVFRCHRDAVKRIVSEESDSHFLTVSEVCAILRPPVLESVKFY
jgi:hypothetical protein